MPKRGIGKKDVFMKRKEEITVLKYQIERYKQLRKGVICQQLRNKLNKLIACEQADMQAFSFYPKRAPHERCTPSLPETEPIPDEDGAHLRQRPSRSFPIPPNGCGAHGLTICITRQLHREKVVLRHSRHDMRSAFTGRDTFLCFSSVSSQILHDRS